MYFCWICESNQVIEISQKLKLVKITPDDLKISDYSYGSSLPLHQCKDCSFIFCPTASGTLEAYTQMTDSEYVAGDDLRIGRARAIVRQIAPYSNRGTWLDVGAGSGDLVSASMEAGFNSVGLEPSKYLVENAVSLGRNVVQKNLLDLDEEKFEVISLIDVIEHVENPKVMLSKTYSLLAQDGVLVIITPDVSSLMARIFGKAWWHIRPAHIGYFSISTITWLLEELNFEVISITKPAREFHGSYLAKRLEAYFPLVVVKVLQVILSKITIQFNLHDEVMLVATPRPTTVIKKV